MKWQSEAIFFPVFQLASKSEQYNLVYYRVGIENKFPTGGHRELLWQFDFDSGLRFV